MIDVIDKPGGVARVVAIEATVDGVVRYYLHDGDTAREIVPGAAIDGVEVGDEFDYEGESLLDAFRISFGGEVLWESAAPA